MRLSNLITKDTYLRPNTNGSEIIFNSYYDIDSKVEVRYIKFSTNDYCGGYLLPVRAQSQFPYYSIIITYKSDIDIPIKLQFNENKELSISLILEKSKEYKTLSVPFIDMNNEVINSVELYIHTNNSEFISGDFYIKSIDLRY